MEETKRVRINAKQTSKGAFYFDIVADFPTLEESSKIILEAVEKVQKDFSEAGHTIIPSKE